MNQDYGQKAAGSVADKSTESAPLVYLIDASIYIFRYYFALPDNWFAENGFPSSAVWGYANWLVKLIQTQKPEYVAACFDESLETCFRNEIYEDYKISRALPDETLAYQLESCKQITELLGVPTYASNRFEADDLICTLAKRSRKKGFRICVVSRDKDLSQVVEAPHDCVWDAPDGERYDYQGIIEKLGVRPEQVADYLALVGDSSDDIPGVPGLGPKTAARLLAHFENWQHMRSNLEQVSALPVRGATKLATKLEHYKAQIDMALRLTRLEANAPLGRRFSVRRKKADLNALTHYSKTLDLGQNFVLSLKRLKT